MKMVELKNATIKIKIALDGLNTRKGMTGQIQ